MKRRSRMRALVRRHGVRLTARSQPVDASDALHRTLAAEVDPLMRPAFTMPEDALPPLQVASFVWTFRLRFSKRSIAWR